VAFLTKLFERRASASLAVNWAAGDEEGEFGAWKSSAGVRVNRETALTYGAIWKGVSLIAGDVGRLPTHIDKFEPNGRRHAIEHPSYDKLRFKPNENMGAMTFKMTLQANAILEGNGYAYIWRNGAGEVLELTILSPSRVTPVRYNGVLWYVYEFENGEKRKLPYYDVLHIRGFSYDGLVGYNLIQKARESIGWAMAMQTYGSIFFRNNATPRVVLEHPKSLKPESAKNLRDSWERLYSGLENAHRTAVLEEGMKANPLAINARDAQLIEQLKFTYIDIANWLKLPPHKVGGDGRTAYASLAQENQAYLDDCLDGWLVTWEEECRDKLLTEDQKETNSHEVRFDRKQLLRSDLAARTTYYMSMLQWGVMSPDEVRHEEGDNAQPGDIGKVYYRPLNMAVVDKTGQLVTLVQPAPAPAAAPPEPPAPTAAAAAAERANVIEAVKAMLSSDVRRMVKRIGLQAERAAPDAKRFISWLDEIDKQNGEVLHEAFQPMERALSALGLQGGVGPWLLQRLTADFNGLADRCAAPQLPVEAARLAGELLERLPGEAVEKFLSAPTNEGEADMASSRGMDKMIEVFAVLELFATSMMRQAERQTDQLAIATPQIIMQVPQQPPPSVTVVVPEQPAPVVNVKVPTAPPAQVTVNVPQQAPPEITVNVPEQPAPIVNVDMAPKQDVEIVRDSEGKAIGLKTIDK
jgi:HK97 family phage portal protein